MFAFACFLDLSRRHGPAQSSRRVSKRHRKLIPFTYGNIRMAKTAKKGGP
jgi:hypothetical protein